MTRYHNSYYRKRAYRWLDAAVCRGAFDAEGSLVGLSPHAIADMMTQDWEASHANGLPDYTDDAVSHVRAWLAHNQDYIRRAPCET